MACHTCQACQRGLHATCKMRTSFSVLFANVPILCQFCLPKDLPIFQVFFKIILQFLNFSIMLNISKFQEYLGNSRKLISRNKESNFDISKISLRKNLVNLKPLTSFSMEHIGLTQKLFGWCERELNIYIFYLSNFICSV